MTLTPNFNEKWRSYLLQQGVSEHLIEQILSLVQQINEEIRNDFQLGSGYEIGHSFFTNVADDMTEQSWFEKINQYEIKPLLEEYFFDRPEIVSTLLEGY